VNRLRSTSRLIFPFLVLLTLLCSVRTTAQAPEPAPSAQATAPVAIPISEEHHHHLVFENAYVNIYFVEIPAHDATLYHHHDFPYLSLPPGGADAVQLPPGSPAQQGTRGPRVSYTAGGFSHTVTNSGDKPLRNVAVELIRPQGTVRNRCAEAVRGQATETCQPLELSAALTSTHWALFETDEIVVEDWELGPNATITPADSRFDTLVGNPRGIVTAEDSHIGFSDPSLWVRGGLLWLPALSRTVFKMGPDGGHYIAIKFKDSAPLRQSE
jgi:hypothetical protein